MLPVVSLEALVSEQRLRNNIHLQSSAATNFNNAAFFYISIISLMQYSFLLFLFILFKFNKSLGQQFSYCVDPDFVSAFGHELYVQTPFRHELPAYSAGICEIL